MTFLLFAAGVTLSIFLGSLLLLRAGRRIGQRYLATQQESSLASFSVVEGAVFALMGLLLAFSISGALQRFDERRILILQEAAALQTAADRIELMDTAARDGLREKMAAYIEARLSIFKGKIDLSISSESATFDSGLVQRASERGRELWLEAARLCPFGISVTGCVLLLPSLNEAFEAATLRKGANERHPPQIVFVMLFGLALAASLLAGFSMAAAKSASYMHALTFATALAVMLYIITDIEFPRLGMIQVRYMDHYFEDLLATVRNQPALMPR